MSVVEGHFNMKFSSIVNGAETSAREAVRNEEDEEDDDDERMRTRFE